ncbi:NUDIX domain-containing protein [Dactylosporangium vinaceum]|uniref:NUDIX hydrolase n=1 Tax=Dactylosporangium vinaceum TaxID=53362 RepID=A0ABV5MEV5_9ACTN|nr:NUDIX domain-containing protein [Dactylosporangium vinaceum]UAB92459.1 NUDIX domain-containing protein [Dactylosporangium vinaceum]
MGATEYVDRVDDRDRVIGAVPRAEALRHGWLHRIAATVCRDPGGRILVYRRPGDAARYPDHHDVMFGGAVGAGESYAGAAARELHEELGVRAAVRPVVRFLCHGVLGSYWLAVHETTLTGPIDPDPREVAWHGWVAVPDLPALVGQRRFIPDGQQAFRRYALVSAGGA